MKVGDSIRVLDVPHLPEDLVDKEGSIVEVNLDLAWPMIVRLDGKAGVYRFARYELEVLKL